MPSAVSISRRGILASTLALPGIARGQTTRRALRLVVPFPPGGAVDTLGRILAERLPQALEQTVVVENRGGAGGLLGADAVAKGPPDGTVVGIIGVATLCAAPFLVSSMPFNPLRDLRAVTQVTDTALVLAVEAGRATERGWTDMASTVSWARANPGGLRVGHSGTGSVTHLALAAIVAAGGTDIIQVPYRGGGLAITDTLAGTIDGVVDAPAALMPHIEAGRMRAIGITSGSRLALLPGVPAMAETAGFGEVDVRSWNAIMAPGGTPDAELARLFRGFRQVIGDPGFAAALRPLGWEAVVSAAPTEMSEMIARETPRWRRLVEVSGARLD